MMNNESQNFNMLQDMNTQIKKSIEILNLATSLKEGERSTNLLSDFTEGFAKGWRIAVSTRFLEALDIKKTDKVEGSKKTLIWTQGSTFSFSQGDIIYDTLKAYERWEIALQSIGIAYQILAGVPSQPRKEVVFFRKNTSFTGSLKGNRPKANLQRRSLILKAISPDWITLEEIKNSVSNATGSEVATQTLEDLCKLGAVEKKIELIRPRSLGYVRYQIMVPSFDKSKLCIQGETTTSQDDFIALLITGRDQPA